MRRKTMKRYLILLGVLVVCAGAVWYFSTESKEPQGNAVLALKNMIRNRCLCL